MQLEPGGTRYNGLFMEDPPERVTLFFRFRVNQMVANSRVAKYEWVAKSFKYLTGDLIKYFGKERLIAMSL